MTDPLQNKELVPDRARELFNDFVKTASRGYSNEDVAGAAINLLINAIRQEQASRSGAEQNFNERFGRAKEMLLAHYDSVTGRRRSVFPFHQKIEMPIIDFRGK